MSSAIDPVWEEVYSRGEQLNRYPWDIVVSFVFTNGGGRPRDRTTVLEVGFGSGANLWFAAREGFRVCGVEQSASAVAHAQALFERDGLSGDLRVGDFAALPFGDQSANLAIDHGALTCVSQEDAAVAVAEVRRVLRPGGRLLFTPFSVEDSRAAAGAIPHAGRIEFYDRPKVEATLGPGWELVSLDHLRVEDRLADSQVHASWRVIAERV
ncbi:MAG: hypothetical protein QOJ29_1257 [Thermoleophilaceae bacterium]|nr:hypothetical protein [Thermoleophilaceae bacterium]